MREFGLSALWFISKIRAENCSSKPYWIFAGFINLPYETLSPRLPSRAGLSAKLSLYRDLSIVVHLINSTEIATLLKMSVAITYFAKTRHPAFLQMKIKRASTQKPAHPIRAWRGYLRYIKTQKNYIGSAKIRVHYNTLFSNNSHLRLLTLN